MCSYEVNFNASPLQLVCKKLFPFAHFKEHFIPGKLKGIYKKAIFAAIKVSPLFYSPVSSHSSSPWQFCGI